MYVYTYICINLIYIHTCLYVRICISEMLVVHWGVVGFLQTDPAEERIARLWPEKGVL